MDCLVRAFANKGRGGISDADVRTLWCKKTSDFSKFMVCPHGQKGRGVEPVRNFADKGSESIFRDFMRTSFKDVPY